MAEREGFEPSVDFTYARFPGVCLKPLSHLSMMSEANLKQGALCRNGFLREQTRPASSFGDAIKMAVSPDKQFAVADGWGGEGRFVEFVCGEDLQFRLGVDDRTVGLVGGEIDFVVGCDGRNLHIFTEE